MQKLTCTRNKSSWVASVFFQVAHGFHCPGTRMFRTDFSGTNRHVSFGSKSTFVGTDRECFILSGDSPSGLSWNMFWHTGLRCLLCPRSDWSMRHQKIHPPESKVHEARSIVLFQAAMHYLGAVLVRRTSDLYSPRTGSFLVA